MQTLGTEWGRELIDPDIWVKAFNFRYWGHNCIITDVRFNNEAEYVRETGLIVHVKGRGGIPGSHKSEDGIEEAPGDVVIWNNQSERILQQRIEDLARKLVEGEVWPTRQT
jgi:membrane glycosyltransferase